MADGERRYRFRGWVFDPRTGELRGEGRTTRLAPQPALVLTLLLERAGELVPRDFLQERVWPDTVVEFDKSLNFCVREVRAALDDSAAAPRFVETLPRRGYRFRAPVELLGGDGGAPSAGKAAPGGRSGPLRSRVPLALAVAAGVAAAVAALGRSGDARLPEPRAREAAEMGGYLLERGGEGDAERSVEFFREAVTLSPRYARAHFGLGSAYLLLERAAEGKAALRRSLELDPDQWAPRVRLALRALYTDFDRAAAAVHFEEAVARAPDQVVVRHTYAWYRAVQGDLEGALAHMRAALELDPVSPRVHGDVGRLFYLAGRHEEAVGHCRRSRDLEPERLRHAHCVIEALAEKGAVAEARTGAVAVLEAYGAAPVVRTAARQGEPAEGLGAYWRWAGAAIAERAERGRDSHVHAAGAWARSGDADRAFRALEAAYAVRCPVLLQLPLDPAFDGLRGDPRYADLLARTGMAPG